MPILPYLILLFTIICLLLLNHRLNNSFLKFSPFILLIVFSGFRFEVGKDYLAYERIFYMVNNNIGDEEKYLEKGYLLFIKLIDTVNGTAQLGFLIFAFFTYFFIYKYISNHSQSFFYSTIIYLTIGPFFLSSFNGVRQALTIALFAFSIKYILERKLLHYLAVITIGALFHKSILMMIPIYWIATRSISLRNMFLILSAVIIIIETGIFSYLVNQTYYSVYLQEYTDNVVDLSVFIFFSISVVVLIIGRKLKFNKEETIFYNLNFFSLATVLASIFSNELSTDMFLRINNYFMIGYVVLIPMLIEKNKEQLVVYYFMVVFCISYYILTILTESSMLPYEMNFQLFHN